ncbi:N-acetylglucosamine kinase [Solitalea longa]|uniref:N-acetylglucosamine kinase n=1 Tax=Solitalea longa TaxID=2079460 RepID=A0A2S5A770_9SPHI|nr:N-acetylglucosamine kinase [Solitalea longa]POY38395.1 N-acetylglucosamine kinase [Solitalea longa]
MIIIADGGSTKTNWCLLNKENKKVYFNTEGYNPYFIDTPGIIQSLKNNLPDNLDINSIDHVSFYGAGCSNEEKNEVVALALRTVFTKAKVFVSHDLLAAARALLGNQPGFAAILGTGTNTCYYDGREITLNIDSLGYMLGDEGSGSHIGRRLLRDYMRGVMPKELSDAFDRTYGYSHSDILDRIYKKPLPNRFLASFSKFLYDNSNVQPYTRTIIKDSFDAFFKDLVSRYPDYQKHTFNCIGSVGYNFRDVLLEVSTEYGMQVGKIVRSPIDDLVHYHINELKLSTV